MTLVKFCFILAATVSITTGLNLSKTFNNETGTIYLKNSSELRDEYQRAESESQNVETLDGQQASPDVLTKGSGNKSSKGIPINVVFQNVDLTEVAPAWSYDTQAVWEADYPLCGEPNQSPINIRNKNLRGRLTSTPLKWTNYGSRFSGVKVTKVDNTVEMTANFSPVPVLSGGPIVGDYNLHGIRWHWGFDDTDGSEHAINSQKYPLEMHAIHYSTRYPGITEALASIDDPEALVIVAVMFSVSSKTTGTSVILTNSITKTASISDSIVLNDLGLGFEKNYYTYLGTLTAPPCSPMVRWIVSGTIQQIKPKQMTIFRSLRVRTRDLIDTFRELQPIGTRTVDQYSK